MAMLTALLEPRYYNVFQVWWNTQWLDTSL